MSATGRNDEGPDALGRYYTPPELALAILRAVISHPRFRFPAGRRWTRDNAGHILEPSIGAGGWVEAVRILAVEHPPLLPEGTGRYVVGLDVDPTATALQSGNQGLSRPDVGVVGDFLDDQPGRWVIPPARCDIRVDQPIDWQSMGPFWLVLGNPPYSENEEGRKVGRAVVLDHLRRAVGVADPYEGHVIQLVRAGVWETEERLDWLAKVPPTHEWSIYPRVPFTRPGREGKKGADQTSYVALWWSLGERTREGETTKSGLYWRQRLPHLGVSFTAPMLQLLSAAEHGAVMLPLEVAGAALGLVTAHAIGRRLYDGAPVAHVVPLEGGRGVFSLTRAGFVILDELRRRGQIIDIEGDPDEGDEGPPRNH